MTKNYSLLQRFTSALLVVTLLTPYFAPGVAYAAQSIRDVDIQSELNEDTKFISVINPSYRYEKSKYIEVPAKAPAEDQTIEDLYTKLLTLSKRNLLEERTNQLVPIAGDVTFFVPIKKVAYPLGKRVGDTYTQQQLITTQVKRYLGRSFVDEAITDSEVQISRLYQNSLRLALENASFTYRLGDVLPEGVANTFSKDFIWPEYRSINGESVLVPIVHLKDTTIAERGIEGKHTVEFVASKAIFKKVEIDNSDIKLNRNSVFSTVNDLIIKETGAISIDDSDTKIFAGISFVYDSLTRGLVGFRTGTLYNHGSISSKRNVDIVAGEYVQKTLVHRFTNASGYGDRLGLVSYINASGNIKIESYADIQMLGAVLNAGSSIYITARGNIQIGSVPIQSFRETNLTGYNEKTSSITFFQSALTAAESIQLMAAGVIQISGASLLADSGILSILAGQGVYISNENQQYQYNRSGRVRKTTIEEQEFQTIAIQASLDAGRNIIISSEAGDIELKATKISSSDGTQVTARKGQVNLLLAKEQDNYYFNKVKKGFWKIKTETKQDQTEKAVYNAIIGGFDVNATNGLTIELAKRENQTDLEVLNSLSTSPELAWMSRVYNDPQFANNVAVVYQQLQELHVHEKTSNLSPAAMAIIAIAVSVAMGPAGAGWVGSEGTIGAYFTSSAALGSAMEAAAVTLATQAATNLANGQGVGGTLEAMIQEDSLRSLAIAMATAGISAQVGDYGSDFFGKVDSNAALASRDTLISIGNQAVQAVVQSTISAGVSTLMYGGNIHDFEKSFTASLKQAGVQAVGKYMAESIGRSFRAENSAELLKYLSHAGAGCVIGLASKETGGTSGTGKESCITGSVGAVTGELVADAYKKQKTEEFIKESEALMKAKGIINPQDKAAYTKTYEFQQFMNRKVAEMTAAGVDLAKLAGAFSALAGSGDVNLGAMTAENAAKNNCFWFVPLGIALLKTIDFTLTAMDLWDIYDAYSKNDHILARKLLLKFVGEGAEDKLIGKIIPGFRTFEELIHWCAKNGLIPNSMVGDLTKFGKDKQAGDSAETPKSTVKVGKTDTIDLHSSDKQEILVYDLKVPVGKKNYGDLSEEISVELLEKITGIKFVTYVKNASNNGPDALAIDPNPANKIIWLVEVKSSVNAKFPSAASQDLVNRGTKWIEKIALEGTWNNQKMSQQAQDYCKQVNELLKKGYVIKPKMAQVSLPAPGSTGTATVSIVPGI